VRWLAIVLVAGCMKPASHECAGGWACPEQLECTAAAPFCATREAIDACTSKSNWAPCDPGGSCLNNVCEPCAPGRAGCQFSGWQAMTSGTEENLAAVWVAALGDAYAVGDHGTLLHYDGLVWSPIADVPGLDASVSLIGIWGQAEPRDIYLLGSSRQVFHFSGGTWSMSMPPSANVVSALTARSPSDVFAGGILGESWHFDGSQWQSVTASQTSPLATFSALATAGNTVFGAGKVGNDGQIWMLQGSAWTTALTGIGPAVKAVWIHDSSGLAVGLTGGTPVAAVFDGTWKAAPVPPPAGDYYAVWGSSGSDIFVGGPNGTLQHFDGTAWKQMTAPSSVKVAGISGSSSTDVFAVGDGGAIWHYTGLP
jgi:hypothetical protein